MSTYEMIPTTPQADAAAMTQIQGQNVGTFNSAPNAFYNKMNFLSQTLLPVPYAIQQQTGNTDMTTIISALVNGVNAGAQSLNSQVPYAYGSSYPMGAYAAPYSPYSGGGAMSPYYGGANTGYNYSTSVTPYSSPITTSSSNMTTGDGTTPSNQPAMTSSSNLTGGLPGTYGMTSMSNATSGMPMGGSGGTSDQLMSQVGAMAQSQMQLMQVQFVVGQESVKAQALTNVVASRLSADRAVAQNLRIG